MLGSGVNAVLDIYNRMKEGKAVAPEALRVLTDNTPFANLFYVREALNYLLLWRIQEWMSPGFLKRYEARVASQQHHGFFLRPSAAVGR